MKLDPATQQYFVDLLLLFTNPGWQQFKSDFQGFYDALKDSALSLKTPEEFWFAKGRADAFQQMLKYDEFITASKKAMDEAPELGAEDND